MAVVRVGAWWAVVSPDGRALMHSKRLEDAKAVAADLEARWGGTRRRRRTGR